MTDALAHLETNGAVLDQPVGAALPCLPVPLTNGIYLPSQAALLAGISRATLMRWLGAAREQSTGQSSTARPVVSFLDLIDLRAVDALLEAELRLPQIQAGARRMRAQLQIDHPLASDALTDDGVARFFVGGATLSTTDRNRYAVAQELVDRCLRDVRYQSPASHYRLATSWEPPGVTIDPLVQRGAPCVAGSRVQITLLRRYAEAGDSVERLAALFGLNLKDVRAALHWYEGLPRRAA